MKAGGNTKKNQEILKELLCLTLLAIGTKKRRFLCFHMDTHQKLEWIFTVSVPTNLIPESHYLFIN